MTLGGLALSRRCERSEAIQIAETFWIASLRSQRREERYSPSQDSLRRKQKE